MKLRPEYNLQGNRQCVVCGSIAHPVARMWYSVIGKDDRIQGHACSPKHQKAAQGRS